MWGHPERVVSSQHPLAFRGTPHHGKDKATLGDLVGSLNAQGSLWQLVLHGHDDSRDVAFGGNASAHLA